MMRRDVLTAALGGMAVGLAQGVSRAQNPDDNVGVTVIGVDGSDLTDATIGAYRSSGADVWQFSGNTINFERFQKIQDFVDSRASKITLVRSYSDILAAKQAGKVAMVVGCQECSPLEAAAHGNDWTVNPPITQLSAYHERGLRIANLSYNTSNSFAGGCLDPTTPLSRAGRFIVGQMQEAGILVDCSHSSDQTTLDIIGMARRPVVCSHSNCQSLNDNPRNASDRIIDGIARTGGLIGVNAVDCFITWSRKDAPHADTGPFPPQATISQYVDMMDHIRRLVGIDHIGIGADFTGPFESPPPSKSFLFPPEMTYYQPHGLKFVKDFSGVTDLPVLRAELERRSYSSVDIAKIFGGNWMRVFQESWNA